MFRVDQLHRLFAREVKRNGLARDVKPIELGGDAKVAGIRALQRFGRGLLLLLCAASEIRGVSQDLLADQTQRQQLAAAAEDAAKRKRGNIT